MENTNSFKFSMPILKTYIDKATNKRIVEGLASGTELDLGGDRMSPEAIKTMKESLSDLVKKSGTLNIEHQQGWAYEIGDIIDLSVDEGNNLIMKAALDESPMADTLWYRLTKQGKKIGLSIEGIVNSFRIVKDEEFGDYIRLYENIKLSAIAVTSSPAYPLTYLSAIAKSVNGIKLGFNKKLSMNAEQKNVEKSEQEEAVVETEQTNSEKSTQENLSEEKNSAEEIKTENKSEDGVEVESTKEDSVETKVEEDKTEEISTPEKIEEDKKESEVSEENTEETKEEQPTEKVENVSEVNTTAEVAEDTSEVSPEETTDKSSEEESVNKSFITKQDFEELKSLVIGMKDMITKSVEKTEEESKTEEKTSDESLETTSDKSLEIKKTEQEKSEVEKLTEVVKSLETKVVNLQSQVSKSTTNRKTVDLSKFEDETKVEKSMEEELKEKELELKKSRRYEADWFTEAYKIKRKHGVIK